jgi:hypothetical protein
VVHILTAKNEFPFINILTSTPLSSIIIINYVQLTFKKNLAIGILMRESSLAFKGLRYHFKKCICGGICAAVKGALRPIIQWYRKNA